ncbi:MAG: ATP--guanido phosphotransferase, partial [candidate division WOR-3 bacterium]
MKPSGEPVGVWLAGTGPESDVVISTRVRLARNLADVPFVGRASNTEQALVVETIRWALQDTGYLEQGCFLDSDEIDRNLGDYFVERHIVSPDFATAKIRRALYVSPDETISLMVNEEDHLRLQVLASGLDFAGAF